MTNELFDPKNTHLCSLIQKHALLVLYGAHNTSSLGHFTKFPF